MANGPGRPEGRPDRDGRAVLGISGALVSLAGLVLALGGRLTPGGSALRMVAGLGMIGSGLLLSWRRRGGAWSGLLAFAGHVSWSLRNVAAGSSAARRAGRHPVTFDLVAEPPRLDPASGPRIERTSAMNYDWQTSLRASDYLAVRILPPATLDETGWDVLLALRSDRHCGLSIEKLASMVSVPPAAVNRWLGVLEERRLITGTRHPVTDELLAVLTDVGRALLDRYFSATEGLQAGAHS